jgi:hypothetical protein
MKNLKYLKYFSGLFLLFTLSLAYQNCSEFGGSSNSEFTSTIPEASIPECKELTSSNFNPQVDYTWMPSGSYADYNQVMSSPTVGDLNNDGIPEIAFTTFRSNQYLSNRKGVLRVLDGRTRTEIITEGSDSHGPTGAVSPLLIDIDRDGYGEIVYPHFKNKEIVALNSNGSLRWKTATDFTYDCYGGLAAADLNGDGFAEIIKNGEILTEQKNANGTYTVSKRRYKSNGLGCTHFAMNLSSSQEGMSIVDSTGVYDLRNGNYTPRFEVFGLNCEALGCYVAAADVDKAQPGKEIIYTGFGAFRIYSASGQILADRNLTEHNPNDRCTYGGQSIVGGGNATIGDFDGNPSTIEFAIATGRSLSVFNKSGIKIAGSSTVDCSSLSTGVTSFDFNGDGQPEILYSDEEKFRVYKLNANTQSLEVLWELNNSSGTLREYPVVADVDNDFSPEIIITANNYFYTSPGGNTGLRILTANKTTDFWMPTRPLWNQHNYFISNVDLNLKAMSFTSVDDKIAQNFRRNLPGKDVRCK